MQANNPELFNEEDTVELTRMVASAGLPYKSGDKDFSIGDTTGQLLQGFVQGFTTLEVGSNPENDYEYVARNLGHLLGFIGIVPGVGSLGKLGASALIRSSMVIGRGMEALRIGGEFGVRLKNLEQLGQLPAQLARLKSVPMLGADLAMESKLGKWAFNGMREGLGHVKFLEKYMVANGAGAAMLQKGMHLGLASAVSAAPIYRLDLDTRLQALSYGFEAGVVFGGIGNLIGKGGLVGSSARRVLADGSEREALGNIVARAATSALYMGLPSTLRGDPTPIQIYDWVSGAVFGTLEKPAWMEEAGRFWSKNLRSVGGQWKLLRPEKLEGWDGLSEHAKEEVLHWGDLHIGRVEMRTGWTNVGEGLGTAAKSALERSVSDHQIDMTTLDEILDGQRMMVEYGLEEQAAKDRGITDPAEIVKAAKEGLRERMYSFGAEKENMYEQFVKTLKENDLADKRATNDLLTKQNQLVLQAFEEEHVPVRFHDPLTKLALKMEEHFLKTKETKSYAEFEVELVKEMAAFLDGKSGSVRMSDLESFIQKVEGKYAKSDTPFTIDRESDLYGDLSVMWTRMVQDRPYMTMMVKLDASGEPQVVSMPEILDGKPTQGKKAASYMDLMLFNRDGKYRRSRIIEVSEAYIKDPKTGKERLVDLTEVPGLKFSRVIADMYFRKTKDGYDQPLMFMGGKKDTGVRLFGRALTWRVFRDGREMYSYRDPANGKRVVFSLEDKLAAMQRALNATAKEGETVENIIESYEYAKRDFKSDFLDESGRYIIPEHKLDAMFDHLYANDIVVLETLNAGVPVEAMLAHGKKFILKPVDWNKRLQVIHSPDYYMAGETFAGLPHFQNGKLPGIIVQVDSKDLDGLGFTAYRMGKDGTAERYVVDTHLDGVMFMRGDYFDRLERAMGQKGTGAQKLTITFAEPGKGMFLGKLLVHRATPELDAHLMGKGWAYKIYDTAAKQQGIREQFTERWNSKTSDIEYRHEDGRLLGESAAAPAAPVPAKPAEERPAVEQSPVPHTIDVSKPVGILDNRQTPIEYTSGQREALLKLGDMIKPGAKGKTFVLAGYAGTGKTTIIENLVRTAHAVMGSGEVHVVAPTNKAVRVLDGKLPADIKERMGGVRTRTIYNLLYGEPSVDPVTGALSFFADDKVKAKPGDWVIVDEASMVNSAVHQDMMDLVNTDGVNVIWIGDTFQLRPVEGGGKSDFSVLKSPSYELTEVRRQSLQSNILKLATAMRTSGKRAIMPDKSDGDVAVKSEREVRQEFLDAMKAGEDAVLIATTNEERVAANRDARSHVHGVNLDAPYIAGEPLISIFNSTRLKNGETFKVIDKAQVDGARMVTLRDPQGKPLKAQFMPGPSTSDGKLTGTLILPDYAKPTASIQAFDPASFNDVGLGAFIGKRRQDGSPYISKSLSIATYAYSITGHKSQGSQWERVFISGKQSKMANDPRWLYTAVTRASKSLTMSSDMPVASADWNMLETMALEGAEAQKSAPAKPQVSERRVSEMPDEAPPPELIPADEDLSFDLPPPVEKPVATGERPWETLIPAEGLRMNFSAGEHADLSDVQAKIQFSGQLDQGLARLWVQKMAERAWRGEYETNSQVVRYMGAKTPEERKAIAAGIDVRRMSAQDVYDVIQGRYMQEGPLFDKVVREVLKVQEDDFTEITDIVDPIDKAEAMKEATARSAAMTILKAGELSPLTLEWKYLKGFLDTRMRKYFRDRVVKPHLDGSWRSKSYGLDLHLQKRYGLKDGEYMAAEGLREKPIRIGPERTTLGAAWDEYYELQVQGKQDTPRYKELDEAMEHFMIRVPADSASGIRILRFKGFVKGSKGYGVFVTPKDMSYMGGMDQDGDAVDVYTSLPDRELHTNMKAYFKGKSMQWHHKARTASGEEMDVYDESDATRFQVEEKGSPEEIALAKRMRSSVGGAFSPKNEVLFHESSTRGLRMLGPSLLHSRRLLDMVRTAIDKNDGIIQWSMDIADVIRGKLDGSLPGLSNLKAQDAEEYRTLAEEYLKRGKDMDKARKTRFWQLDEKTKTSQFVFSGKVAPEHEVERILRDVVNTAADASKGYILKPREEIFDVITRTAIPDLKVHYTVGGKKEWLREPGKKPTPATRGGYADEVAYKGLVPIRRHPVYAQMAQLDRLMRGRNQNGARLSFEDVISGLNKIELRDVLKHSGHTWYLGGLHMGRLQLRKTSMAGYNTDGVQKLLEQFVGLVNKDPRLAPYAILHHFQAPQSGLDAAIAGMKQRGLSSEQMATEINQLVFNDIYSAVSAIKLMQSGKAFAEDFVARGRGTETEAQAKLLEISTLAEELKTQDATMFSNDKALEDLGFKIKGDRRAQDLHDRAYEMYQKLSEPGKEYFAYRLLGSLYHQDAPYLTKITPLKDKVDDLSRRIAESEKVNGVKDFALVNERGLAQAELDRVTKEFYHRGISRLAYTWDFIHPSYIKSMLSTVNELLGSIDGKTVNGEKLARAVSGTVHLDGISSLMKEVVPDAAGDVNVQYKLREYHETFLKEAYERSGATPENPLDKGTLDLLKKFEEFLYHYPHILRNLPALWEGVLAGRYRDGDVAHNIRQATKRDLKTFMRHFMYHGKFWHELTKEERDLALKRRHFLFDPESLGSAMRPVDNEQIATYRAPVALPDGNVVFKDVKTVLSTFDSIAEVWQAMHFSTNGTMNEERKKLETGWKDYEGGLQFVRSLGEDGETIFSIVSDIRQRKMGVVVSAQLSDMAAKGKQAAKIGEPYDYEKAADEAEARFKRLYDGGQKMLTYTDHRGSRVTESAVQIHARIMELQTRWAERVALFLNNPELEREHIKTRDTGEVDVRATLAGFAKTIRQGGRLPFIGMNGLYRVYHQMLIEKLYVKDYTDPNGIHYDRILYRDIADSEHRQRERAKLEGSKINASGWMTYDPVIPFAFKEMYFPHNGHPRKLVEKIMREKVLDQLKAGDKAGAMDAEAELKSQATQANDETGGWADTMDLLEADTVEEQGIRVANLFKVIPTPAHHRGAEPLPGWDKSTEAFWRYETQMIRGYHKMLGSLMSHSMIGDFVGRNVMGKNTGPWAMMMKIYNRDNMGYPSTFRKEWLEDPSYMIRNNMLYYPLTDQFMLDQLKKISRKYQLYDTAAKQQSELKAKASDAETRRLRAVVKGDVAAAEQAEKERNSYAKQAGALTKKAIANGSYGAEEALYGKARVLANLEAKWEMISLLSHTKTMAYNLFDGNVNTAVSTGMESWVKAKDFKYLKQNVFTGPEFNTMRDIERFAEEHGAGETYIVDVFEAGTSGRQGSLAELGKDVMGRFRGKPSADGYSFEQKMEQNAAMKGVMDVGSWPMRYSERYLRNRAWLAHYLKAREVLGASMQTFKYDDPWLIAMANRGVAGTQFLYNNAARPAFARTMLGRVFSRFQMYAFKSTKMRVDIMKEAAALGYDEGTEAFQKLQRRMTADLFMWGLAMLFPASMFSSVLGGPLSQLKEMATFFFGDDEDKERSFYSPLPYPLSVIQVVSPPVMRIPYATFGTLMTGDWDKFASQHVWTWFPFGRIARDVYSFTEKPALAGEKFLGMPFHQMQRLVNKAERKNRGKKRRFESPIMGAVW